MRSSQCSVPKKEYDANLKAQVQKARFLHDLLEYGPWDIDIRVLAMVPKPFDFDSEENIFKPYKTRHDTYRYYRGRTRIFLLEEKKSEKNTTQRTLDKEWEATLQAIEQAIPQYAPELQKLASLATKLARFDHIEAERTYLPSQIQGGGYGCCVRTDGRMMDLNTTLGDAGSLSTTNSFAVFELAKPVSELPGNDYGKLSRLVPVGDFKQVTERLLSGDHARCRLQKLPENILTDNTQGHWDLFWPDGVQMPEEWYAAYPLPRPLEARDPARDIRRAAVTIDFGTSSTVVAMRDQRGEVSLLRVGVQAADMRKPVTPEQFENPTVLSFENVPHLLRAWAEAPFRPNVSWNDVQCSHQARAELAAKMRSGFPGIKTWARGKPEDEALPITDSHNMELFLEVPPVVPQNDEAENLVGGKLNPIELYAFFLGLYLNNQSMDGGRIFTEYYMTFPVKFDRETRDRILAGFRRGLLRSLPPSLIYASRWDTAKLTVAERACEPAAFAAAILPLLNVNAAIRVDAGNCKNDFRGLAEQALSHGAAGEEKTYQYKGDSRRQKGHKGHHEREVRVVFKPANTGTGAGGEHSSADMPQGLPFVPLKPTKEGVAFGVFDFGGGTTDFAIGLYRLPTAEESEDQGWEKVLEILDTSGDENLGGEHLVQLMAYEVVKNNKDRLLEQTPIPFVKPVEGMHLTGAEELFGKSSIARANMRKLCEKLRCIWENGALEENDGLQGQISETFTDREGKEKSVVLNVDENGLRTLLKERIAKGVDAFFHTFAQAFKQNEIETDAFHIILAGNSCKSPLVKECFKYQAKKILKKSTAENCEDVFYIYPPQLPDPDKPESVTLKTGVAIGLLNTLDGEPFGMVSRHAASAETPFGFYVGPMVDDCLQPVLKRNDPYGTWQTFSKVRKHGKCKFLYSLSPLAIEGKVRRGEHCIENTIDWGTENAGKIIVVQATTPDSVTFALKDEQGKILEDSKKVIALEREM